MSEARKGHTVASFSEKVSNDVSEDIDCGETRKELREVISYLAHDSSVTASECAMLKVRLQILTECLKILLREGATKRKGNEASFGLAKEVAKVFLNTVPLFRKSKPIHSRESTL